MGLERSVEDESQGKGPLGNPTAALAKTLEGLEQGESVPVASEWWRSVGSFAFGLMEGMSSDENDLLSSDEEG